MKGRERRGQAEGWMRAKPRWPEKATWMQQRVSVEGAGEDTSVLCYAVGCLFIGIYF